MEPLTPLAIQLAMLAQMIATPGALYARTLILFQNNISITNTTLLAALTEATFTGYAAVAAQVFAAPYIDQAGLVRTNAPSVPFVMTDTVTPNTIYGWALTDSGKTILVLSGKFPSPIVLSQANQGLDVQPTYAYGD